MFNLKYKIELFNCFVNVKVCTVKNTKMHDVYKEEVIVISIERHLAGKVIWKGARRKERIFFDSSQLKKILRGRNKLSENICCHRSHK